MSSLHLICLQQNIESTFSSLYDVFARKYLSNISTTMEHFKDSEGISQIAGSIFDSVLVWNDIFETDRKLHP